MNVMDTQPRTAGTECGDLPVAETRVIMPPEREKSTSADSFRRPAATRGAGTGRPDGPRTHPPAAARWRGAGTPAGTPVAGKGRSGALLFLSFRVFMVLQPPADPDPCPLVCAYPAGTHPQDANPDPRDSTLSGPGCPGAPDRQAPLLAGRRPGSCLRKPGRCGRDAP